MKQTSGVASLVMLVVLLMLITSSCDPSPDLRDQRLADFAIQSMEQQARQNEHLAQQSQAVIEESEHLTEASKQLVASDAAARQELLAAQDRWNVRTDQQRAAIDTGRDQLEQERRQLAQQRGRDPIIAESIQTAGLLAACLLPLLVCVFVLRQMHRDVPDDAAVTELLVSELTSEHPRLLSDAIPKLGLEHAAPDDSVPDPAQDRPPHEPDPPPLIEPPF
jgi:hypothetical protein